MHGVQRHHAVLPEHRLLTSSEGRGAPRHDRTSSTTLLTRSARIPAWTESAYRDATLRGLGHPTTGDLEVSVRKGHHASARLRASDGTDLFVKRGDGGATSHETLAVETALLRTLEDAPVRRHLPRIASSGRDPHGRPVLVVHYCTGHESLLAARERGAAAPPVGYTALGATLSELHRELAAVTWPADLAAALVGRVPAGPTVLAAQHLSAVSASAWADLGGGSGTLLGIAHRDDAVRRAAASVYVALTEPATADGVVHGDLRPDHVLVGPGSIVLADWETAHVGRFEEDLASLLAELLLLELLCIGPEDLERAGDAFADAAAGAIGRLVTPFGELLSAYEAGASGALDRDLLSATCGVAMAGRLMAMASAEPRPTALQRSALGVALALVTEPAEVGAELGLRRPAEDPA